MSYFSTIITKCVFSWVLLFFVLFSYFSFVGGPEVRTSEGFLVRCGDGVPFPLLNAVRYGCSPPRRVQPRAAAGAEAPRAAL